MAYTIFKLYRHHTDIRLGYKIAMIGMKWRSDSSERSLKRSFIGDAQQDSCQQSKKAFFALLFLLRKKVRNQLL